MFSAPGKDFGQGAQNIVGKRFHGIVIDNKDHEAKDGDGLKAHRVKVRIAELHRNIDDEHIPWAQVEGALAAGGTGGISEVHPIVVGSEVWVTFCDNSVYSPKVTGVYRRKTNQNEELLQDDYPNVHGKIDQAGNIVKVNTTEAKNSIDASHNTGTSINIDKDGTVTIVVAKKVLMSTVDDITINCKTHIVINCQQDVTLNCKGNFTVNCENEITYNADTIKFVCNDLDFNGQNIDIKCADTFNLYSDGPLNIEGSPLNLNTTTAGSPDELDLNIKDVQVTPKKRDRPKIPDVSGKTDM